MDIQSNHKRSQHKPLLIISLAINVLIIGVIAFYFFHQKHLDNNSTVQSIYPTISSKQSSLLNGHAYVDLGLPSGLKWATSNIGAEKPEDYGDYFAWGETEPYYIQQSPISWKTNKPGYAWSSYFDYSPSISDVMFLKYNFNGGLYKLSIEDDAAHVIWGEGWRIPTPTDFDELRNNCTWVWSTRNGTIGYLVKSKINSNQIFLPAAGYRDDYILKAVGLEGYYWTNYLRAVGLGEQAELAQAFCFGKEGYSVYGYIRYRGRTIRPVLSD